MPKAIRPVRIDGNIAFVTLTRGYEAVIDSADVPLVEGYNWYARVTRRSVYAGRTDYIGTNQHTVLMHRALMGGTGGLEVDHCDGNGLNNRRDNLREATPTQNSCNQRVRSDNVSGFKGVTFNKQRGKFQARITLNGRLKYLGLHKTPEAAHTAYCEASSEIHKEFGRTE